MCHLPGSAVDDRMHEFYAEALRSLQKWGVDPSGLISGEETLWPLVDAQPASGRA